MMNKKIVILIGLICSIVLQANNDDSLLQLNKETFISMRHRERDVFTVYPANRSTPGDGLLLVTSIRSR